MLAYIGLGSNLNNPKQQIQNALIALNDAKDVKVVALSRSNRLLYNSN